MKVGLQQRNSLLSLICWAFIEFGDRLNRMRAEAKVQ